MTTICSLRIYTLHQIVWKYIEQEHNKYATIWNRNYTLCTIPFMRGDICVTGMNYMYEDNLHEYISTDNDQGDNMTAPSHYPNQCWPLSVCRHTRSLGHNELMRRNILVAIWVVFYINRYRIDIDSFRTELRCWIGIIRSSHINLTDWYPQHWPNQW